MGCPIVTFRCISEKKFEIHLFLPYFQLSFNYNKKSELLKEEDIFSKVFIAVKY